MTVSNQTNRTSVVGTGAEQIIPFTFPIVNNSDIVVTQRVTATGVETTLAETTDYTVTNNGESGGSITTVTPFVASSAQIHIVRDTPNTQLLDLEQGGSFNAENIEDAFDKATKLTIENKDALSRVPQFPTTDPTSSLADYPNSIDRASLIAGWDSAGKPNAQSAVPEGSVGFTAFGTSIAEAADAATVRGLIGTVFDITAFGALGDGVLDGTWSGTDDTSAIQAAIDAQTVAGVGTGTVLIPNGNFMFSNLTIPPTTKITGLNMWRSRLCRITGSTGNGLEDTGNAAKIMLTDFIIYGNDTTGVGINLGNNDIQWGAEAYMDHIMVRDITNGFNINGNVGNIGSVICWNNTGGTAFRLQGSANTIHSLVIASGVGGATTKGLHLSAEGCRIFSLHTEGEITNPLYIDGFHNTIFSHYHSIKASVTTTDAVYIASGKYGNSINQFECNLAKPDSALTNFVNDQYSDFTIPWQSGAGSTAIGHYTQGIWNYNTYTSAVSKSIVNQSNFEHFITSGQAADITITLPQTGRALYQEITIFNDDATWNTTVHNHANDAGAKVAGHTDQIVLRPKQSVTLKSNNVDWLYVAGIAKPLIAIPSLDDTGTPSVIGSNKWLTGGTTTITDFDGGFEGQVINVLADHTVKISDNTNIILSGNVDFNMLSGDTLTLVQRADTFWYERARSANTAPPAITLTNTTEISSGQMLAMAASPVELVAAQGADTIIEFVSAIIVYDSAATDYTVQADENMAVRYENGAGAIVSLTVESDNFIKEPVSDGVRIVHPIATFQDTDIVGLINKSLVLDNVGSGEWDDGTGTMTVKTTYRVHTLGL